MKLRALLIMMLSVAFIISCAGPAVLSQPPNQKEIASAVSAGLPVAISGIYAERDSANGIDVSITFKNLSKTKTIKYCWFTVEFINAVGDIVTSSISNKKEALLSATGPYKPGKNVWGGFSNWPDAFYHANAKTVRIKAVEVEYMDGEKVGPVDANGVLGATGIVDNKVYSVY